MDSLCKEYSLKPIYKKVDGAFIKSQNEKQLECIVTFQTHSILQRFLLRFEMLSLDCNDHLFIYDGSHAVGEYKVSQLFNFLEPPTQKGLAEAENVLSCF